MIKIKTESRKIEKKIRKILEMSMEFQTSDEITLEMLRLLGQDLKRPINVSNCTFHIEAER